MAHNNFKRQLADILATAEQFYEPSGDGTRRLYYKIPADALARLEQAMNNKPVLGVQKRTMDRIAANMAANK